MIYITKIIMYLYKFFTIIFYILLQTRNSIIIIVFFYCNISIYFISFMALGCSLMWPALWPLAMADLGKFTKSGSSLLIMAMAGGAVIPTLFGYLKDISDIQKAYWICLPCFLFILYYGVAGYKIRTK